MTDQDVTLMIDRETYYRIRCLYYDAHFNKTEIAQNVGLSYKTVREWLKEPEFRPPKIRGERICDPFGDAIVDGLNRGLCATDVYRDLAENHGFRGSCTCLKQYVREQGLRPKRDAEFVSLWILRIVQGDLNYTGLQEQLKGKLAPKEIQMLHSAVLLRPLKYRKRALAVLAHAAGIPKTTIAQCLFICTSTVNNCIRVFKSGGAVGLLAKSQWPRRKHEEQTYIDTVFSVLHAPPACYGFNRTTWRMDDLHQIMEQKGLRINRASIRKIIKDAGYRFRKAKKVLTSNDPEYREKLQKITAILSSLGPRERFFSVDEFGPFSVRMMGGKSLMPPGTVKTIPQRQKSKGTLILTGALELSTNQMTHFYSDKKDTKEMIKLLEILLKEYKTEDTIYFSWDAASWHASKELYEKVEEVNSDEYREEHKTSMVKLAPLPSGAQFLNVIESVFSGMARAIIHNSDYASVEECKAAIDRHFVERNEFFQAHPKRAGNKIWGKERVSPVFSPYNNCKDPSYR